MPGLPELSSEGSILGGSTDEELDAAGQELGIPLPPSYRQFAKRYGYGLSCGLFMIYVPHSPTASKYEDLVGWASVLGREAKQAVSMISPTVIQPFKPDGSAELLLRLVHFAMDENGNRYGWDPDAKSDEEGERWIYAVQSRSFFTRKAAPTLGEFVRRALEPGVGGILGTANFTLKPTFRPWHLPPQEP